MKYRIKITTFKNGRQLFNPQVKLFFNWCSLNYDGEAMFGIEAECDTRISALNRIDKHFAGNTTKQTIEFEYINR